MSVTKAPRVRAFSAVMEIARGSADAPDAAITSDPDTLAAVLWRGRPLADARIRIDGDPAAVERFVRLFPMPL
jgi:hypothetical protein